jgi:hypothetical protein
MRQSLRQRFAERAEHAANGCEIWTGRVNAAGTPLIFDRYAVNARRVAVELTGRSVPRDCVVARCPTDTRCVRVDHVRVITRRELALEVWPDVAANVEKERCPAGHRYDEKNTYRDVKGQRHCRTCHRDRQRARDRARAAGAAT